MSMENELMELVAAPRPEYVEGVDFLTVTDDQILAALFGETVELPQRTPSENAPFSYLYTLVFNGKNFVLDYFLGTITCDENCLRLIRLF